MRHLLCIGVFSLAATLAGAENLEVQEFLGDSWYGLYLNGDKAGYSQNALTQEPNGDLVSLEDARFKISMAGIQQDMHIYSKRTYAATGELKHIESEIVDPAGTSRFVGVVQGDGLILTSTVGGQSTEQKLPLPKETLADAIKLARWMKESPKIGDSLQFSVFEPMYQKEILGTSTIAGVDERMFEGVMTKVYQVKTSLDMMGVESVAYVAEDGTTLEDAIAGIITMRLEPEEIAKDVDYKNDVIVSNAAMVDKPIKDARTRASLKLNITGPLTEDHLFNDERQKLEASGDQFVFTGTRLTEEDLEPVQLPVMDPKMQYWLEPTVFVQSDDPKIKAKAKEIVGDEKDTFVITEELCHWVKNSMRSTFSARLTNALEVLDSLAGDCTEHSILFIALARAAGVPAREVAGLIYVDGAQPGFYFHQWAKVWVGEWIDVDPTFNQPLADVTHIKLAEGDLFRQARLIPVIGKLQIEVVEDAKAAMAGPVPLHLMLAAVH